MKPSQFHPTKKHHNWLMYKIGDRFLKKYSTRYKGALYDLGCGESPYRQFFLQYVDSYVGVDWGGSFHSTMVDIVADLNKPLPMESEVADTVVSLSVLEHLCEPQTMLNEACRILKHGGRVVLQVPWQWWIHEAPYDYFRYTPYGLKYMFEKAGFQEITVEPSSGFFSMWILKANYFSARFIRGPKPLRLFCKGLLVPFWHLGQVIAPLLDKLDRNPNLEAVGYWVVAVKP